jgi:hypothetical protein
VKQLASHRACFAFTHSGSSDLDLDLVVDVSVKGVFGRLNGPWLVSVQQILIRLDACTPLRYCMNRVLNHPWDRPWRNTRNRSFSEARPVAARMLHAWRREAETPRPFGNTRHNYPHRTPLLSLTRDRTHLLQIVTSPGGSPPADQSAGPPYGGAPVPEEETSARSTATSTASCSAVFIGISTSPVTSSSSSVGTMAVATFPSHVLTRCAGTGHSRAVATTCTLDLLDFPLG